MGRGKVGIVGWGVVLRCRVACCVFLGVRTCTGAWDVCGKGVDGRDLCYFFIFIFVN